MTRASHGSLHDKVGLALLMAALTAGASCRSDVPPTGDGSRTATVLFEYASSLPSAGCPAQTSEPFCSTGCIHTWAPISGEVLIAGLWDAPVVNWQQAVGSASGRASFELGGVPVARRVRATILDKRGCCFDACDVWLQGPMRANGVLLTHLVTNDLPASIQRAVEFEVTPDGRVLP